MAAGHQVLIPNKKGSFPPHPGHLKTLTSGKSPQNASKQRPTVWWSLGAFFSPGCRRFGGGGFSSVGWLLVVRFLFIKKNPSNPAIWSCQVTKFIISLVYSCNFLHRLPCVFWFEWNGFQLLTEAFAAGHEDATFGSLKNGRVGG